MAESTEPTPSRAVQPGDDVVVVPAESAGDDDQPDATARRSVADQVEEPAKVMRIGTMIRNLLAEVKAAPLDDASRRRLGEIHRTSLDELEEGLAPELVEELERLAVPFSEDHTPSDAELRIAHAQLVGWLEGLFQGIQTTLLAQQMSARGQLEQMRRALPPGQDPNGPGGPGRPGQPEDPNRPGSGMYL